MKAITARFGLLFIALLVSAPSVLGATSANTKITCEQVGDIALKIMFERQSTEQLESTSSFSLIDMSWEGKILTAGISLRATQTSASISQEEKLASIVKFGELIYEECMSGKLGLMQQYVDKQPVIRANKLAAIEEGMAELGERLNLMETSLDSVNSFRQDTNRSLDQLQSQIRNLAYSE